MSFRGGAPRGRGGFGGGRGGGGFGGMHLSQLNRDLGRKANNILKAVVEVVAAMDSAISVLPLKFWRWASLCMLAREKLFARA